MSIWTTKSLEKDSKYIVLKHTLKGVNHTVNGVKFRDGYAVVEKDSKIYLALKKIPVLRASKEYPLSFLRKLPFITRISDIRTVFGQDVYAKFLENEEQEKIRLEQEIEQKRENDIKLKEVLLKQLEEAKNLNDASAIEQITANIPVITKCSFKTLDGTFCKEDSSEYSPSGYCSKNHLLEDPRLPEFGLEVPRYMTKDERRAFKNRASNVLQKAKSQGKF